MHPIHTSLFRRVLKVIPPKAEPQKRKAALLMAFLIISAAAYLIFSVTRTAYLYAINFSPAELLFAFANDIQSDEQNRINMILLGTGNADHDGPDLTDTMIIASLNKNKNTISMLSIPRDLWIDQHSTRINKIYETLKPVYGSEKALNIFKESLENITNLEIPYYIKVNFTALKEVVDILGGIEIVIPTAIVDTQYPKADQSGYETFQISSGLQTLDGETALRYARSRHSTSDFDRATRQQMIIQAIKQKMLDLNLLSSPLTIKQLYNQFKKNVETNLKTTELITLARMAKDLNSTRMVTQVLKDQDVVQTGSFLYTPPREEYSGAFVLRPMNETYKPLQLFINILFSEPEFFTENATVEILNGTHINGLATSLWQQLVPFGVNIQNIDNADQREMKRTSFTLNNPQKTPATAQVIRILLPFALETSPDETAIVVPKFSVTITLGEDFEIFSKSVFENHPGTGSL